jgi:GPN-loop GTPase
MLRLMRIVDRATGCIYVPSANAPAPPQATDTSQLPSTKRPNIYSLFSSAAGSIGGARSDVRDVQERWLEAKDEWDEHELEQRKKEYQKLAARESKGAANGGTHL